MADVSPSELQTLIATLQAMTQQLGNIAKAIANDPTTFAAAFGASAPTGPVAGYLSVNVNGTIVKVPYYES